MVKYKMVFLIGDIVVVSAVVPGSISRIPPPLGARGVISSYSAYDPNMFEVTFPENVCIPRKYWLDSRTLTKLEDEGDSGDSLPTYSIGDIVYCCGGRGNTFVPCEVGDVGRVVSLNSGDPTQPRVIWKNRRLNPGWEDGSWFQPVTNVRKAKEEEVALWEEGDVYHKLLTQVEDVKEKLTDREYKDLVENIAEARKATMKTVDECRIS